MTIQSKAVDSSQFKPEIIQELGRLDIIAKVLAEGIRQGTHSSRRKGFSTEFSDFNPYVPGDDLRFIDWRLYARTDRLYIKNFQAETNLEVMLVLDATQSMAWRWKQTITKLEYGINLLAAIGYLHIRNHDMTGLLLHDAHDLHFVPPKSKRSQLEAMFAVLEKVEPAKSESFARLVDSLASYHRHRGRVLICSDLEENEEQVAEALEALAGHDDEVILVHLLDHAEEDLPFDDLTHIRDSETGELLRVDLPTLKRDHAEQVAAFRQRWQDHCQQWGIIYIPVHSGESYVDTIVTIFDKIHHR